MRRNSLTMYKSMYCSPEQKRTLAALKQWRADIRRMIANRRAAKTAAKRAEARA